MEEIVSLGITQVPEKRRLFQGLTVRDNLRAGAYLRNNKTELTRDYERVFNYFPILFERKNQYAGTLSGGEQQMLALARGLMSRPKLLLLDEPSFGLAPLIVEEIFGIISRIKKEGTAILLAEQNARGALLNSDFGYVLVTGEITMSGESRSLLERKEVQEQYLGKKVRNF
jgi:branched-chain amino acid transport system ATP-binding protein